MLPIGHGKAQELMPPQGSPLASSPSPSTDDDFRHAPSVGRQPSEAGLRSMANRFRTKTLLLQSPDDAAQNEAERILRRLCPDMSQASLRHLRQERIQQECDLAALDKEDLQQLGLSMVQRARVLSWSRAKLSAGPASQRQRDAAEEEEDAQKLNSPKFEFEREQSASEAEASFRLDTLESDGDFWCDLWNTWSLQEKSGECPCMFDATQLVGPSLHNRHDDVREDLLEALFDLSPERIFEVFQAHSSRYHFLKTGRQLSSALGAYGLPEPAKPIRQKIISAVCQNADLGLQLPEFEAIVSRTVLARLVTGLEQHCQAIKCLKVTDYSTRGIEPDTPKSLPEDQCRRFFFGHRSSHGQSAVRWVHVTGLELSVVLALAVKYSLHPLAVEDTIQQNPCKIDRYGDHYFGTIERISLTHQRKEHGPVEVLGHHVSFFCSGAPNMDTVITVCQEDQSFEKEWPHAGNTLVSTTLQRPELKLMKIEKRLRQPMSRLRERRANFFVHAVLDICADEISDVVRAFGNRLQVLEQDASQANRVDWAGEEAATIRTQLALVDRRAKSLQRVVRRLLSDEDFSEGMFSYLSDVVDHLEEARDDSGRLSEKCVGIQQMHDRLAEQEQDQLLRDQEMLRAQQADRLNNILFVLTLVTTIFCPAQFLCGVYGMNFVDDTGRPGIPELLWKNGYLYFWLLILGYLIVAFVSAAHLYRFFKSVDAKAIDADSVSAEQQRSRHTVGLRRRRQYHSLSSMSLLDGPDPEVPGGAPHPL
ncbi:yfjQ [Symbiodinium necroappetens]|uniref:YfjQ protein n=1 Tax=Symbiodinium necroappetens TaxID=1628268 RepID=A0A812YXI4_9DINO|nr:yfjQ [Symbiodinium necroappetens]